MIFKKGQVQGQVFIYILTLIIAGVIFMFGYNAVSSFTAQIEASKLLDFETDVNSVFDKIGAEYQSYEEHIFYLPNDYSRVCFANLDHEDFSDGAFKDELLLNYPLVHNIVVASGIKHNVFVYSHWLEKSFSVGKIKIINSTDTDISFACYELFGGKLDLYIRGLGDRAEIEEAIPDPN